MKIVIIASFFPYPAYFGGAFDVLERLKGFKSLGHDVDLICTCKEIPEEKAVLYIRQYINELYIVSRTNKLSDLFYYKPLQVISRKLLKKVVLKTKYDFAILESESVGMILKNKTLNADKLIVRVHNNESKYFNELAKSTKRLSDKTYYYFEALKFKFYSKNIFSKVDRLWFISNKEINNFKEDHSLYHKSLYLPAANNSLFLQQKLVSKKVLFIGSLFMPNNMEAIVWYLKNVHTNLLHENDYKLIIVGSTGEFNTKIYQDIFENYSNIEIYFNQKDLSVHYLEAVVFINPMLHGAGVKLKTINAIQNGLPLVSTTLGAEGIGLIKNEMYFEANTPTEFSNAISKFFQLDSEAKQKMVNNAQEFLQKNSYLSILKNEIENEQR